MTDSSQKSDGSSVRTQLKELLQDMLTSIDYASEDQQRNLLNWLQKWQKGDRRKYTRRACSIPVKLGRWQAVTEYIKNICMGGAFIKTSAPLSGGEQVTLIISLPNQKSSVKIKGRVAWNSSEGVGVEFTEALSKELKKVIESL